LPKIMEAAADESLVIVIPEEADSLDEAYLNTSHPGSHDSDTRFNPSATGSSNSTGSTIRQSPNQDTTPTAESHTKMHLKGDGPSKRYWN
jgi:hypothetical protein